MKKIKKEKCIYVEIIYLYTYMESLIYAYIYMVSIQDIDYSETV